MTPRQMVAKKALHVPGAQPSQRNASLLKPLAKVFRDQDMVTNPGARVSTSVQIQPEGGENYAQVIGRHAAAHVFVLEQLLNPGDIRNTMRFQDTARLPPAPSSSQMQIKIRSAETSPSHNFHLSISAIIESFR